MYLGAISLCMYARFFSHSIRTLTILSLQILGQFKLKNFRLYIKAIGKNKAFHFIISRYATFFLQFINSLFVAVYLGPYYLGVWGFITLVTQYLSQSNFGIANSVNTLVSIHKDRTWYVQKIIGTSIVLIIILSLLIFVFLFIGYLFSFEIGVKYGFSKYAVMVSLIGVLSYFNGLFSNVYRIYGRLYEIALSQSAFPVLMLFLVFLFKGVDLLWGLVYANFFAFFLSFVVFIIRSPIKLELHFNWRMVKKIQGRGWHLFVYSTSFYFILISTRTFVSWQYSVNEFGVFTFAFSLANAILLLLQALSYLVLPKLLNKFARATNGVIFNVLSSVRDSYVLVSHGLVHIAIFVIPYFLGLFPKYNEASLAFTNIALTIVLYTNSFGYQGLLIARGKEALLSGVSFFTLLINMILAYFLTLVLSVPYPFVIIATMVSYLLYVFLIGFFGRKTLELSTKPKEMLKDIFPFRVLLPYLLSLTISLSNVSTYFSIMPLLLFVSLNLKNTMSFRVLINRMVYNPRFMDI